VNIPFSTLHDNANKFLHIVFHVTDKDKLIDLIFQLAEEEEEDEEEYESNPNQAAYTNTFTPQVSGIFRGNQTNYYVMHTPNFYRFPFPERNEASGQSPKEPCDCHECCHHAPPAPTYEVPTFPPAMNEDADATVADTGTFIEPCNALLQLYNNDDDYYGYYTTLECSCVVPTHKLLENVSKIINFTINSNSHNH
jgi:hypothetical protein